ncbi:MAG: DUF58 domain-containing protein [Myxococcota bacterium]
MSIYPTRTAAHLAVVGVLGFVTGIVLRERYVVAWGGAILVGIALARAVTLFSVMRIRAAGFEMLWTGTERRVQTRPGGVVELVAEVRNRDTLAARFDKLRVIASPALETWVEPPAGEVPATGSVQLVVSVRARRVGYHGIYGLALEVRGAPGLFEVPLTFANPYGIEVRPKALVSGLLSPRGGRSRTRATAGRPGRQRGDGYELHELREHVPGDSFRRIAWRASARRNKLVVKEFEQEERDVVTVVLDASVELWAGEMGRAPLDRAIETAAGIVRQHVEQGDLVGLRIVGGRELAAIPPDEGRAHMARVSAAFMDRTGVLDFDRCAWDTDDIAAQVAEHLRPLDPRGVVDLRSGRLERLAERADNLLSHAPFDRPLPAGAADAPHDARLRRYAACFGMHVPPRVASDPGRGGRALARCLLDLAREPRASRSSIIQVVAPCPRDIEELLPALRILRARKIHVRWVRSPLPAPSDDLADAGQIAIDWAVTMRADVQQQRSERALRKVGVKFTGRRRADAPSAWEAAS